MYSPRLIQQKLSAFSAREGWEPEPHSIAEVEEFTEYVKSISKVDENSKSGHVMITKGLKESRVKEIRRFVQNEQIMCAVNANYFETKYAYICDEKGEIFKFKNRVSQDVFDSIIAEFEDREVAIELFCLKGRQVGISTKTALKFLHRMLFMPNTQAVMASVQAEKSELIGRILNICLERCPWWLVPMLTTDRIGKMKGFDNGSILSIQSGSQATGIAQGWTPTLVHVSEIGDLPNPKKVIEEGLLRATHSSRKLFLILEGTGNGNTGWQADKWRSLKEDYPKGLSRLCPMFLSWPLATDLYPEADWLRAHPIPEAWQPINETVKHVRRCETFIRNTDYLSKICGPEWQMPRRQQWFWEFNYREAVKSHTQRIWMSQMPADDFEALTGKNDMVFDQEVIHVRSKERAKNYKAYAVTGNSIDEGFEPDPSIIDYDTERIHIHWDSNRGNSFDWILIPLKPFDETEHRNVLDKLLVYEEPKEGRDYAIGIDTADGYGKEEDDRAVMSVAQSAKGNYPDIQVAEFVSNRVNPAQMVGWAAAMGAWYGKVARNPRGAKFCIEQRERPGDDCQYQLKLMGFNYHHEMVYYDDKRPKEGSGYKHGWSTNSQSRPILMNTFIDAVTNGWYKANSLWLLAECKDLERKVSAVGKTKVEHQSGKHDDRVFGAALSYITSHHMDIHRDRSKKQYAVNAGKPPDIDMSHARVSEMSVGD